MGFEQFRDRQVISLGCIRIRHEFLGKRCEFGELLPVELQKRMQPVGLSVFGARHGHASLDAIAEGGRHDRELAAVSTAVVILSR